METVSSSIWLDCGAWGVGWELVRNEFESKWESDRERPWMATKETSLCLKAVEGSEGSFRG